MATKKQAHLRLTAEQVKKQWLKGRYTASGYLWHLIQALRKEGWWYRIENVDQFCEDWAINKRTFYRAKASLIASGELEESTKKTVELRVLSAPDLSSSTPDLSSESSETIAAKSFQQPLRSIQIYTDFSQIYTDPTLPPSENACEDLNLNPNGEEGSAPIESPLSPVQAKNPSAQPEPTEPRQDSNVPPRENHSQNRFWATSQRTPIKSDARRFEQQFEELPPWLVGRRWSDINQGFAQYLRVYLPKHVPYFEGKDLDMPAIKTWAMKARGSEDRYEGVEIAWDAYQEERAKPQPPPERDIAAIAAADIAAELAKLQGVA